MKYVKLGNSDLEVSRICMGCMGFLRMMDMPVIAATRFKSDICKKYRTFSRLGHAVLPYSTFYCTCQRIFKWNRKRKKKFLRYKKGISCNAIPGSRLTASFPSSWYHPLPAVQIRSCPPPLFA